MLAASAASALPAQKHVGEMRRVARAAGGDDGNLHCFADRGSQFAIEAVAGAVGIHGGEQNFACAALLGLARPFDDVAAGGLASASMKTSASRPGWRCVAAAVDGDDDGLGSEARADFVDQLRDGEGGGVDADFVRAGIEDCGCVVECPDASADGERTNRLRAVRRTVSSSVPRPSCVAVMSSSTISSAPASAWRAASSAGSPASTRSTNCTPLTTRPPSRRDRR